MQIKKYDFGTLHIDNQIIIGEIDEGVHIQIDTVSRIIEIANKRFNGKHWGYISNRINSYSLNPIVHMEAPEFEKNMIAFAVVVNRDIQKKIAEIEEIISKDKYKFKCFLNLDEAIVWVKKVINEK